MIYDSILKGRRVIPVLLMLRYATTDYCKILYSSELSNLLTYRVNKKKRD